MTKIKFKNEKTMLISFKVSKELYAEIVKVSRTMMDDAGLSLSPSLAARRLMLEALRKAKR